ncbi:amidohydrolase family protein [Streptomyces sp. NBC_00237]|uniref:amidohydrolase family protein n=1 Tax=Streptomyces sp. NBC_00237 TaxID=2975687 RepID=UPI00225C02B7|nr:amidohydrolase family protein [Streptomyces sp. NBC_00237]MCX5200994.1 amidohydrolase family protein [Streptomyces sp. NBC_00237]
MPRRTFLQAATVTVGAVAVGGGAGVATGPQALAAPVPPRTLHLTAATNGSATAHRTHFIAEVQNVLWSFDGSGGPAKALTPPDLEPTRPVLSPDGRQVALAAYRGGHFHIWVMNADGSGLRRLTEGPWDDRGPVWSPDGTRLAFSSERGGDPVKGSPYRIWTVEVRTGQLSQLTGRESQSGPHQDKPWEDFDPAWGGDGTRVLFVRGAVEGASLQARTIASVPADGSGAVTVVHAEPATAPPGGLQTPAVSPAGRTAWLRSTATGPTARFQFVSLVVDGKNVQVEGSLAVAPPRWLDDEHLLVTLDGQFQIVRPHRDPTGRKVPFRAELPVEQPSYRVKRYELEPRGTRRVRGIQQPVLAPDGRSFAFVALNSLWVQPTSGRGARPRRVVEGAPTSYLQGPSFSRDGRWLLYVDDRDGLNSVRRVELATGKEELLAQGGRTHPALSPDGKRLACLDMTGGLVVRDLASGAEKVVAAPLGGGGLPGPPSWSPDGRHVAYADRNRLNYRFREGYNLIRVVEVATGASRLHALAPFASLSDRYASGPAWSHDGKWLACVSESALWVLPVGADGSPAGEAKQVSDYGADQPSWAADSRTILYLAEGKVRLTTRGAKGAGREIPVRLDYRSSAPAEVVVHAGRLWDGTAGDGRVRSDVDILIRDGRIAGIEPHREGRKAGRFVDASRQTVLPGLWDAHTHPWQYTYGARQTAVSLAYGITTTVSLAGFSYEQARLREDVVAGRLAGPRLLTTGELLDGSRVAYSMGRAHRTQDGLRRSLARGAALDWDFVKTYVRAPLAYMERAARFGHEELGVLSGSHLVSQGVQSGEDLTSHLIATERAEQGHGATSEGFTYGDTVAAYTEGGLKLLATPFVASPLLGDFPELADDVRVTAMMPPWDAAAVRASAAQAPTDAQRLALRRELATYRGIVDGGGRMAIGTDTPITPVGLTLHIVLRAMVRGGFTAAEALRSVTRTPAELFGAERDLGTVEVGKLGDLTVVDGNPLEDFDDLVKVSAVLVGGRVHEREALGAVYEGRRAAPGVALRAEARWEGVREQMEEGGCC